MPEAPNLDETAAVALVRTGYDAIADEYLELARQVPATHPRRERTEALLARLPEVAEVLEVGCGGGLPVARRVVDAGHRYTGVDISERQVALARQHVPEGHFVVGDIGALDFPAGRFAAVLMLYVLTHVPRARWGGVLRSVHDWLAPAGLLLFNVPGHGSPSWLEEDFLGLGVDNWTNALGLPETEKLLGRAGFAIVESARLPDDEPGTGWFWILAERRP